MTSPAAPLDEAKAAGRAVNRSRTVHFLDDYTPTAVLQNENGDRQARSKSRALLAKALRPAALRAHSTAASAPAGKKSAGASADSAATTSETVSSTRSAAARGIRLRPASGVNWAASAQAAVESAWARVMTPTPTSTPPPLLPPPMLPERKTQAQAPEVDHRTVFEQESGSAKEECELPERPSTSTQESTPESRLAARLPRSVDVYDAVRSYPGRRGGPLSPPATTTTTSLPQSPLAVLQASHRLPGPATPLTPWPSASAPAPASGEGVKESSGHGEKRAREVVFARDARRPDRTTAQDRRHEHAGRPVTPGVATYSAHITAGAPSRKPAADEQEQQQQQPQRHLRFHQPVHDAPGGVHYQHPANHSLRSRPVLLALAVGFIAITGWTALFIQFVSLALGHAVAGPIVAIVVATLAGGYLGLAVVCLRGCGRQLCQGRRVSDSKCGKRCGVTKSSREGTGEEEPMTLVAWAAGTVMGMTLVALVVIGIVVGVKGRDHGIGGGGQDDPGAIGNASVANFDGLNATSRMGRIWRA